MGSIWPAVKWLSLIVTPVLLLGFHYRQSWTAAWRTAFAGLMGVTILAFLIRDVQIMSSNIAHPPKWDFLIFWVNGRAATQNLNFYDLNLVWQLAQQYQLPFDQPAQVYFFYLPPTMLLFLPLGWFDPQTAFLLWYVANMGVLLLDIILLWKIFLKKSDWMGLMLTTALVFTLNATTDTIYFGQTNFIVLLMLLLFWREHERSRSGVWLAMGIFTKHILGVFLMFLALCRSWRVMVGALMALVAISLLALIVLGPEPFFSYFTARSTANAPASLYIEELGALTEQMNQSLLATILRLTNYDFSDGSPLTQPIFVVLGLILTIITGWLVFRLRLDHADWGLSLTLALALLVYPATLEHYSLLLIAPMLLLWAHRQTFIGGVWGVVGFITLEYALIRNSYAFVANALAWSVLAGIGVWMIGRTRRDHLTEC